jgi:hypothetical protein
MNQQRIIGTIAISAIALAVLSVVAMPLEQAFAVNRGSITGNQQNNQGGNQQTGLVNAGNVNVQAQVGVGCSVVASC